MASRVSALAAVAAVACGVATTSAAQETSPFPRGWIVFSADTDRGIFCCDLFKIRTDGTGLRRLAAAHSGDYPAFAPNGRRVAFPFARGIFTVNLDGSGRRRLTNGYDEAPAYSPDGKRIAFLRGFDLYVMRADGREQRRLRRGFGAESRLSWTPDGKSLVVSVSAGAYDPIYLDTLDARTGRIEKQTLLQDATGEENPGSAGGALLSPDGRTVVFTGHKPTCADCDPAYALYRKQLPRGPVRHVCDVCSADSWSADSHAIAWGGNREVHLRLLRDGRTMTVPVGGHVYSVVSVALQPR